MGEGFDDARLDTLFLTLPVSWCGTMAQYAGRLHRLRADKSEVVIHDYADLNDPLLARMFDRRCKNYEAIGYTVKIPASAMAGWAVNVPLPSDQIWKNKFSASVRRMIRDGVNADLANLFVQAAQNFSDDAEGVQRARSITEAFLYQRLQTLPETAGRFLLNQTLPIPFDGYGKMEVDISSSEDKITIEIDGAQHLADANAYRRDRKKDVLLQENGWFVLRFLAEDVCCRLPNVLDTILRTLTNCQNKQVKKSV